MLSIVGRAFGEAGDGMGKTIAYDGSAGVAGTVFYSGWLIQDVLQGPGDPNTLGEIYAYDVASGISTLIYSDPGHGIPDIEVNPINQRIYWTDYVRGEIRSADYNGANVAIEVVNLDGTGNNDLRLLDAAGLALGEARPALTTAWRNPDVCEILVFEAEVFSDKPTG